MTPDWGGWLALQAALYAAWAAGIIFITVIGIRFVTKWLRNRIAEARMIGDG